MNNSIKIKHRRVNSGSYSTQNSARGARSVSSPRLLLVSGSMLALSAFSFSTSAFAQATPQNSSTLAEVVVTARHRSEDLQKTPFSIAAVSAQTLKAQHIVTTMDLDNVVPGLELRPDNIRLEPFVGMRGVGDYSRNPGIDNRVGLYLDGVPLGRSTSVDYPIYDIDSVEVLRGPQGTLFGNNSLTGVIAIDSQKPTLDDSSRLTLDAGSRNLFSGSGYLNTKLSDDLAMRVTLAGQTQDGYYKNLYDNSTLGGGVDFAGRIQLRYTPTDSTTFDLTADAVGAKDSILLAVGQYTNGPDVGLPNYTTDVRNDPSRDRDIYGIAGTLTQKLPGDFTLTSISSYRTSQDHLSYGGEGEPADIVDINFKYTDWDVSQEVRIASPVYKYFDYVVGVFYYHDNPGEYENLHDGLQYPVAALQGVPAVGTGTVTEDQEAAFAHGSFHPVDWLAVDGGLRVQNTTKNATKIQDASGVPQGYPQVNQNFSLSEASVNPLASITITPIKGINVYALYSTGDRAGGFNMDLVKSIGGIEFQKESVVNYEVGIKTQLFDNRLRINADAYTEQFSNFQQSQNLFEPSATPGGAPLIISVITNAAKVKSEGVEADFNAALYPGLRVYGGFDFNHAYYQSFPNGGGPGVSYTGNVLPEAPHFQASVTVDYKHQLTEQFDGDISATYTTRTSVYSQPADTIAPYTGVKDLEDGYGDVTLRVAAINKPGNLEFAVFVKNLTGEIHVDGAAEASSGTFFQTLNEPRTIGVELTVRH